MNPAVLQCGPALDTLGREHVESAPLWPCSPYCSLAAPMLLPCCSHAAPLLLPCCSLAVASASRPGQGPFGAGLSPRLSHACAGPDEIKGFANIRALGNKIPESAR